MIPSAEGFAAMVVALDHALTGAEEQIVDDVAALPMIRASRAIVTALSHMAEDLLGVEGDEVGEGDKPATDDPATCGHPDTFASLPNGQVICATCGASTMPDDAEWRMR